MRQIQVYVFALIVWSWTESGAMTTKEKADSLYRAALEQVGQAPVQESLTAFRRVLKADWNYAPAHFEMAKLYMSLKTPLNRQSAGEALQEALRLDPENVDYQVLLGQLMWDQGAWLEAKRQYEKVGKTHPESAKAACGVGYYYLQEFLRERNMVSAEMPSKMAGAVNPDAEEPVLVKWNRFAEKDWEKAISHLERSLALDPRLRDAYYHLGVACMESGQPEGLTRLAEQLLNQYPGDKDALLFCGLGHQTAGSYQKAYEFYTEALQRMPPEERAMMESVDWIATEKEQRQMLQAERQRVSGDSTGVQADSPKRDGFWRGQDPLFLTEFNENRMEHYSRVAYANLHFSQPSRRIAGWRTDKGKTYIRFGRPLHQGSKRPEEEGPDPLKVVEKAYGGETELAQTHFFIETWTYEGFQLKFVGDGLDGWSFAAAEKAGNKETNFSGVSPEYVFRGTSPRYVDPYQEKKYSMPHQVAAFRQGDSIRVEFSYAIPKGRLRTSDSDSLVDLEDGVFLFDERWKEVYRDPKRFTRLKLPVPQEQAEIDSLLRNNVIFFKTLRVGPGPYHMAVEGREKDTESIGTFRDLRTFSFADTSLMMSDLLLASRIERRIPIPERREDLAVMPNPLRTYYRSNPVSVYFEVYNLKPDGSGKTEYDVSYRISRPEKQEVDPALFVPLDLPEARRRAEVEMVVSKISASEAVVDYQVRYVLADRNLASGELEKLERGDRRGETEVTARYAGGRRDDFAYLQIDVGQMPAGVYKLRVKVRDAQTGRSAERETLFRVIQ